MLDIVAPLSSPIEDRTAERDRFAMVRQGTEGLAANLTPEDQAIQSMPESSLMCVTPHTRTASEICSKKTPETAIPLYYFDFRDRN